MRRKSGLDLPVPKLIVVLGRVGFKLPFPSDYLGQSSVGYRFSLHPWREIPYIFLGG
jgi:hypothetical protein